MRAWPCQRTTVAGISLPSATISTAGWSPSSRAPSTTVRRTSRSVLASSRNAMCCDQGSPTISAQAGAGRLVEDRPAGHGVDPDGVDAEGAHQGEVVGHLAEGRELPPRASGANVP